MSSEHVSDIERAAATILEQCSIEHPILAEWIKQITTTRGYDLHLSEFQPSAETLEDARDMGYAIDGLSSALWQGKAHGDIRASGDRDEFLRLCAARDMDAAAFFLATSLVSHLRAGSPDGNRTTSLGHDIALTTSLAANIAEYVRLLSNVHSSVLRQFKRWVVVESISEGEHE